MSKSAAEQVRLPSEVTHYLRQYPGHAFVVGVTGVHVITGDFATQLRNKARQEGIQLGIEAAAKEIDPLAGESKAFDILKRAVGAILALTPSTVEMAMEGKE